MFSTLQYDAKQRMPRPQEIILSSPDRCSEMDMLISRRHWELKDEMCFKAAVAPMWKRIIYSQPEF
jgi:hypothetical protein